ncbi:hypothetical protein G6F46_015747 [Rhizopus delemar]|nr:hypothetical protein G6F22_022085 [Rhizopus arrhizus]KAG1578762.1 hypothetical protein G6F46_015747 [Rhizopus delemar]
MDNSLAKLAHTPLMRGGALVPGIVRNRYHQPLTALKAQGHTTWNARSTGAAPTACSLPPAPAAATWQ